MQKDGSGSGVVVNHYGVNRYGVALDIPFSDAVESSFS
jgi:hypothetical protein